MDIYPEPFSPQAAIASVCAVVGPMAHNKRIQIHGPATPGAAPTVTLDPQKFKQILFNLLSNAVKFTDPGGQISITLGDQVDGHFSVQVRDTGIGIAASDMERLFEAFRQLDGGSARRYEGTGLGLSLTRKLVELQGGRIHVESEPGVGSTFTVLLPVQIITLAHAT